MKYLAIVLSFALSGCQMLQMESMLETAPQHDSELVHPEWGVLQQRTVVYETRYAAQPVMTNQSTITSYGQSESNEDSLELFLRQNRIDYEVLPGNHVMVKLNQHIQFNTGSSTALPTYNHWIDTLGSFLAQRQDIDIVIEGHTDNTGSSQINDPLSEKRAKQVKARLEQNRVPSTSIYTRGFGEYVPACNNYSAQGQACNRRVELMLIVAK